MGQGSLPQQTTHSTELHPGVATPVKQSGSLFADAQQLGACPYGSPISGVCSSYDGTPAAHVSKACARLGLDGVDSTKRPGSSQLPSKSALSHENSSPLISWPASACTTTSMPELWQPACRSGQSTPRQQQLMQHGQQQQHGQGCSAASALRLSADNRQRRDQDASPHHSNPNSVANSSPQGWALQQQQHGNAKDAQLAQLQPLLPLDVLLSPLLPSADEVKLLDRLSQLRSALDEHVRLASGWEQQAVTLQQALSEVQQEALTLRGQVASQQHHISLLGGNLQGRLSLVQGSVLAQMQAQVADKDAALAASEQQIAAIQAQLEHLSCSFTAKLAAEQAERQRLSAEASQARLLCMARGRQVTTLQQQVQQMQDAVSQQHQTAAAADSLQQQQLEGLREKLQKVQEQLAAAHGEAAEAQQAAAAAEGGKVGLRQQIQELQGLLADKQLQLEWLEGKVADLEGSGIGEQVSRHKSDVAQLQEAAAAERRALEQQLAAAQRQVLQLQQQDSQQQQLLAQLQQQGHGLQEQLAQQQDFTAELQQQLTEQQHVSAELQQQLAKQQQTSAEAQAGLVEQLSAADAELQQLREELELQAQAAAEAAADAQQKCSQLAAEVADADANAVVDNSSADASAAVAHALRAQLGLANAEVARLRHQLDVATAAQHQERELTGQEIWRLQQELSEAAASASGASGAAAAGTAAAAAAADEVTSRIGTQQAGTDSSSSWHSVHDNPAFEQLQQPHTTHAAVAAVGAGCVLIGEDVEDSEARVARYEARLQDQADTIMSLQRQLKQQQLQLATLQKRERRVHDSAASRGGWIEALGLDEHSPDQQQQQGQLHQQAGAAASTASTLEPGTPHADAAVQTDLNGPAESAGSTAAAPAASGAGSDADDAHTSPHQHQRHHHLPQLQQQQQAGGNADAGAWMEARASSALLAAARHEILRLQDLNRQLLQTHAEELKASVSFEDARRAVSEAKQHTKAKAAAMLQANNKSWSDKLAAARAEQQLLEQQVLELKQHRDQLAQQAAVASASEAAVQQLQQELYAAQQHSHALQRQLAGMADSHNQQLEQVRLEAETEAAAALLDAAAASSQQWEQQQQQQQQLQQQSDVAVQTAAVVVAAVVQDAAVQTEQQWAHIEQPGSPIASEKHLLEAEGQGEGQEAQQQQQQAQQQELANDASGGTSCSRGGSVSHHTDSRPASQFERFTQHSTPAAAAAATPAATDDRPCTPQPSVATPGAASASRDPLANPAALLPTAITAQTPPRMLSSCWRAAADAADDDLCRLSSASDTPASASSCRKTAYGSLHMAAAALDSARPGSAGTVSLPELTASNSPVAPGSVKPLLHPPHLLHAQPQDNPQLLPRPLLQQQQQQDALPVQPSQLQQQQQADRPAAASAQMGSWHAELLQQQVQLEALRVRLSQQQQGLQPRPRSSSSKASEAVANSRTLLLAPFGHSAAALGAGSPAGPIASSTSPTTLQQRRAAAQTAAATAQQAAAADGAGGYPASAAAFTTASSSRRFSDPLLGGLQHKPYVQQPTVAEQQLLGQQQHQQQQQHFGTAAAAAAGGRTGLWSSSWRSESPEVLAGSVLLDSTTGSLPTSLGIARTPHLAAAATPAAAAASVGAAGIGSRTSAGLGTGYQPGSSLSAPLVNAASVGAAAVAGSGSGSRAAAAASAVAAVPVAGLAKLGDDVLGALSLSRYHRERSKLQEARAKQHALLASHHEDQAAALRNSRMAATAAVPADALAPVMPLLPGQPQAPRWDLGMN